MNASLACRVAGLALALGLALARPGLADSPRNAAPEPRKIPVPALGSPSQLPGVNGLPVQEELPPALGKGAAPSAAALSGSWPARRAELKRLLEHYLTGNAPPAPGNVRGSVVESRQLADGRVQYRRVQLSFGKASEARLEIGIFTPAGAGPFPALIDPAGTPPGATPLPRLPLGPGQGQGVDAMLSVGPDSPAKAPPRAPALDAERIAREHPALAHGYAYVVFDLRRRARPKTGGATLRSLSAVGLRGLDRTRRSAGASGALERARSERMGLVSQGIGDPAPERRDATGHHVVPRRSRGR